MLHGIIHKEEYLMRRILCGCMLLLLGIIVLCGCGFGLLNMPKDSQKPVPKSNPDTIRVDNTILHPEAIRIENTSLIIATPFKLETAKKQKLGELEPYIKNIVGKLGNDDDICIIVNGVSFDSKKIEMNTGETFVPNSEGALKMGLENMKNTSLVKDLKVESMKNIQICGLNGKEIRGGCTFNGKGNYAAIFRGSSCYHGGDMFSVLVFFPQGNSVSEKIADAVFESILVLCHDKKK